MNCFDIDLFFDQITEEEPADWFVLHMMGCEQCRENFEFYCMLREAMKETYGPLESTGEALDDPARHWMNWMSGDKPWGDVVG